jgi:hypothetical protein
MAQNANVPRVIATFDRDAAIGADYSAGRHIAQTLTLYAVVIGAASFLAVRARPLDWLLIPAFWVAGNLIEWLVHKGPMHRPAFPRIMYKNHALMHHRAFLHGRMEMQNFRELGLILMPWYTIVLVLAGATPVVVAAYLLRGPGAVGIFFIFAMAYFASYELLHALYHTPESFQRRWGLWDNRLFRFLQAHHAHHHRLDRMSHVNFNVTLPLWDVLLRTRETPALDADEHDTAHAWDGQMTETERREAGVA